MRAEGIAVEQVFIPYDVFLVEIHDPQIGIEPGRNIALAFEAKPPGFDELIAALVAAFSK